MRFKLTELFQLNEIGERNTLEDYISPALGCATLDDKLFIICDGAGGNLGGLMASKMTCHAISEFFYRTEMFTSFDEYINDALKYTIIRFKQSISKNPQLRLMSTTLALAYIVDDGIWITWCGDSRIYHIRDGNILWQSRDHSLVQQLADKGEISNNEALDHPDKNVLLKSINAYEKSVSSDVYFISNIKHGDYLLLCSDGLLENVSGHTLHRILNNNQKENDKLKLFKNECSDWTMDNYSMILLGFG